MAEISTGVPGCNRDPADNTDLPQQGFLQLVGDETRDQVESDLKRLIEAPNVDDSEIRRRKELLELYRNSEMREPIEFTSYSMKRRR